VELPAVDISVALRRERRAQGIHPISLVRSLARLTSGSTVRRTIVSP
jgi:hypothetical protein